MGYAEKETYNGSLLSERLFRQLEHVNIKSFVVNIVVPDGHLNKN